MYDAFDDKLRRLRDLHRAGAGPGTRLQRSDVVHESLLAELRAEMAAALGRAGDKVSEALDELAVAERALEIPSPDRDPIPESRKVRWEAYQVRYAHAERALWQLRVHREAIGLLRHDPLKWLFPLPLKRKREDQDVETRPATE
ncbi:MAG: hypothetical protein JRI25_12245 [Deltaproteobacteria bacterium]|nr:hypothetical protein [Deltaproteobacteria bacterium]